MFPIKLYMIILPQYVLFRCPLCTFETLFKADVKVHIVKKHTASEVLEKCEGIEKDEYIVALDKVREFLTEKSLKFIF